MMNILPFIVFMVALNFHVKSQHLNEIDSLKNLISDTKGKSELADHYLNLSLKTYHVDANTSARWAKKVLGLPKRFISDKQRADAYAYYGRALSRLAKPDAALKVYLKSLNLYASLQDTFLQARMYNAIGSIYLDKAIYHSALNAYYQALKHIESLGPHGYELALAKLLNNIGNIHFYQHDQQKALEHYNRAHELIPLHSDSLTMANTYNNIAVIYDHQKEFNKALPYYTKALSIYRAIGNIDMQCNTLHNIGNVSYHQGNIDQAEDIFITCLNIGKRHDNSFGKLSGYIGLTSIYTKKLKEHIATAYADSALQMIDVMDRYGRKTGVYNNLFTMFQKLGKFEQALNYHIRLKEVNDSIYTKERNRQIQELNTRYQTEKQEQEILLLEKEKKRVQTRNKLIMIIFILVFLIAALVIYNVISRHRKSLALLQKEKELDQFKNRLFTNISHELRTPLTLIHGPLEKLIKDETMPKRLKMLKLMQKNTVQVQRMINQILDLAKIDAGKLELQPQRQEVVRPIRRWVMTFQSLADMKDIELNFSSTHDGIEPDVDMAALETMINNLLSNAMKYETRGGRVDVFIGLDENQKTDQRNLKVTVKNYHSFIPENERKSIFQRYYRISGQNHADERFEGTGIGLALVKELVTLHRGTVHVHSSKKEGTTFDLKLPLSKDALIWETMNKTISHDPHPSGSIAISDVYMNQKKTAELILVIEDNLDVREFIRDTLNEYGYKVLLAENGNTGVDIALKTIPDLIISDVMMPGKDGYALCHALKNDEKTNHVPIILLTAKASYESKMKGLETLADDYLVKPFNTDELLARSKNLVELRKKLRMKYAIVVPPGPTDREITLNETFLQKIRKAIDGNLRDESFGVEELAKQIGMSRSQLHRKLTGIADITPNQFIRNYRLEKAMNLLRNNSATSAEIAYEVGFSSPAYFGKCFKEYFRTSPGEVRNAVNK